MGSNGNNIYEIMDVCRLCLGSEDLISIFDDREKIPENIINVIQVTTGVTIKPSDIVSQKLCNKCLHITIKMFKFRSSSIINDVVLKNKAARKMNPVLNKSVEELLRKYPKIVLPSSITKNNISPVVKITEKEIFKFMEKYNRVRKANKNIREPVKLATKLAIQDEMPEVKDLENKLTPYVIQNKNISVRPQLFKSTDAVPQNLIPTLSADVPKLTSEIDELQKPPLEEISSSNDVDIISESIMDAEIQDNRSKRKLSVSPNLKKTKKFKLGTDSVNRENSIESLVTLKYVTKSLLICDICNGILYNAKDLKKHKMNHMKCNLCKIRFRSLEETKEHSESGCTIKKFFSNLPTIMLERCDQSKEFRKSYPLLIDGFNKTIEELKVCSSSLVEANTNQPEEVTIDYHEMETVKVEQVDSSLDVKLEPESAAGCSLISDDENEVDQSLNNSVVNQSSCNTEIGASIFVSQKNDINNPLKNMSTRSAIDNLTGKKKNKSPILSKACMKPDIKIISENILDVELDDTEINLLRNLLKRTKKLLQETCVQTDIPCNADILPCSNKDKLFELKNLNKCLTFYKIPVNLCFAPQYSVKFTFEPSPTLKKDSYWSKIIPKKATASKTLPVNDIPQKNTLNNKTPYEIIDNILPQGLSSSCAISSINPILNVQSKSDQRPDVVNLQGNSISGVATTLVPTMLHTAATNFPQSNNTFSIAQSPILNTFYVMNQNSCEEAELQIKSHHNSMIPQKNVNYSLLDHSILSKILTNRISHQNYVIQNNYFPSNNTVPKNVTVESSMNNNMQISPIIRMPSNAHARPLFAVNHITTDGINGISSIKNVFSRPQTLVIRPTIANSEVSSSTQTERSNSLLPSTIETNSENHSGSNFPPPLRVKDVSELR